MDAALVAELQEHYQLNENPFGARTGAFYDGAQRKHNLEVLRHMAIFGDMVLLLTGEHGAGKSTLLARFVRDFADEVSIIMLGADSGAQSMSSLERLAVLSGMSVEAKQAPQELLERLVDHYAQQYQRDNKRILVVIDDAHTLSDAEMNALLRVMGALEPESGAALLLAGPPSLTQVLAEFKHPARDEWFHQIQLKHLSKSDSNEYLMCLFQAVGYAGSELLTEAQLAQLSDAAGGLPGALNALFPLVALNKMVPNKGQVGPQVRAAQSALLAIAMVLVLVFAVLLWRFDIFTSEVEGPAKPDMALDQDAKAERLAKIESAMQSVQAQSEPALPAASAESAGIVATSVADKIQVDVNEPKVAGRSEANQNGAENKSAEEAAVKPKASTREQAAADLKQQPQLAAEASELASKEASQAPLVASKRDTTQVSDTELKPADKKHEAQLAESKPALEASAKVPASSSEAASKQQQEEPAQSEGGAMAGLYRSKAWLLAQADSNFSAQVLGSFSEVTAKKFAQKLLSNQAQHGQQVIYLRTRYKNKPWFVVLYGQYSNKSDANKAVKNAPTIVVRQRPWVRSFAGIKSSL